MDADGYIEKAELGEFLRNVGEPLNDEELQKFYELAVDKDAERPNLVEIKRIANILLPKIVTENELTKGVAGGNAGDEDGEQEKSESDDSNWVFFYSINNYLFILVQR